MGLPFKNGYELAKAMGYGKLYQASKEKEEENNEMLENIKKMMGKINEIEKRNIQEKLD